MIPTGQLGRSQRHQQFCAGDATVALLERPDPGIQGGGDVQVLDQFAHRGQARVRCQRRIRRADTHRLASCPPLVTSTA